MIFTQGDNKNEPSIKYIRGESTLCISGSSYPENVNAVYANVLEWIQNLDFTNIKKFVLQISLKYYNTATSKKLFEIIKKVNNVYQNGYKAEIHWHYFSDDEDMFESGRYYSELVEVPFYFTETPN